MGAIVILLFIFFLLGCFTHWWNSMVGGARNAMKSTKARAKSAGCRWTSKSTTQETTLDAAVANLAVAGYMDDLHGQAHHKLILIDDEVLSELFVEANQEEDLRRSLPQYGLRLMTIPKEAPEAFKTAYNYVVASKTHALGVLL